MEIFKERNCSFSKSIYGIVTLLIFQGSILLLEYEPVLVRLSNIVSKEFLDKYFNLFFYGLFLILFGLIYRKKLIESLKDFRKNHEEYLKVCGMFALIVIAFIVIIGITLSKMDLQSGGSNEQAIDESLKDYGMLSVIWICFIGPFVEEIVYRGIFFEMLRGEKKNIGRILFAILITAILFGVIHCDFNTLVQRDYIQLLAYTPQVVMGLFFTILYEKTDNIFCPYFVHMVINIIACSG